MASNIATTYRIVPTVAGDVPDQWAVPMPAPHTFPERLPWVLLYLLRAGWYGGPLVLHAEIVRRDVGFAPRTLRRALQQLVDAGFLVPLDRQEGR